MLLLLCGSVKKFTGKQTKWILFIALLSLALVGALIQPRESYDLYRHYAAIEAVKKQGDSLWEFMINGYQYVGSNYQYTYGYNLLVFIIASFFPKQALPFIAIMVSCGGLYYVIVKEFKESGYANKDVVLAIAIFSVLMPYLYIYSGIRNAIASSIIGVGVYDYYKGSHNIIKLALFAIVACSFHPGAVAIIPFIVVSKMKPGVKGIIITFLLPSLVFIVMEFFRLRLNNPFLFKIGAKYYNYTQVRIDNQGRVFLYTVIGVMLIVVALAAFLSNRPEFEREKQADVYLVYLIVWYMLFSLGYFKNYEMITRLPYNVAVLSPVIVNTVFRSEKYRIKNFSGVLVLCKLMLCFLALMGLYENIAWLA